MRVYVRNRASPRGIELFRNKSTVDVILYVLGFRFLNDATDILTGALV